MRLYLVDKNVEYIPINADSYIMYIPVTDTYISINDNIIRLLEMVSVPSTIAEIVENYILTVGNVHDAEISALYAITDKMIKVGALVPSNCRPLKPSEMILPRETTEKVDHISLHVTYRCNLSCSYCYSSKYRNLDVSNELNASQWKRIIDECISIKCQSVYITGGEPTLRSDLFPIWKYAIDSGLHVKLLTNGYILDEEMVATLATSVSEISLSVDSVDRVVNDELRGCNTYDRVLDSIRLLKSYSIPWSGQIVASGRNLHTLTNTIKWLKEESGSEPVVSIVTSSHDNEDERLDVAAFLDSDKVHKVSSNIDCIQFGVQCGAAINVVAIGPEGYIYPCKGLMNNEYKGINVLEHGIMTSRDKSPSLIRYRNIRYDKIDVCANCVFARLCQAGICRALAFMRTGSVYGYIGDAICRKKMKEIIGTIKRNAIDGIT